MPRIRTVKPEHWEDKELPNISLQAHLLWIGIWNFSDDDGVIENDSVLIRSKVFPRRTDIRIEQVREWIDQLVKARFLVPFEYQGESYLLNRTFVTHQKIDRPQPSKIPSEVLETLISGNSTNDRRTFDECSTNDRPCRVEESSSKVKESKGEGENARVVPDFSEFENYALDKAAEFQIEIDPAKLKAKYEAWKEGGWRTGKGNRIKNWKTTLLNTLNYLTKEKSSAKKEKERGLEAALSFANVRYNG